MNEYIWNDCGVCTNADIVFERKYNGGKCSVDVSVAMYDGKYYFGSHVDTPDQGSASPCVNMYDGYDSQDDALLAGIMYTVGQAESMQLNDVADKLRCEADRMETENNYYRNEILKSLLDDGKPYECYRDDKCMMVLVVRKYDDGWSHGHVFAEMPRCDNKTKVKDARIRTIQRRPCALHFDTYYTTEEEAINAGVSDMIRCIRDVYITEDFRYVAEYLESKYHGNKRWVQLSLF